MRYIEDWKKKPLGVKRLMKSPVPNLACATIPAQSSIPLVYIFGAVLDLGFSTWSAVQRGGYIAQARVGRN